MSETENRVAAREAILALIAEVATDQSIPYGAKSSTINALAESFNGLYKWELIHRHGPWRGLDDDVPQERASESPGGLHPLDAFDQLRNAVLADRSQFWKDLSSAFYGYNRPGAIASEGVRESFWLQGMRTGLPASYFCIKAFSETDFTEDLKRIDVPTLILHGDADQIVPIGGSALLSAKIVKGAKLKVYPGASHGMCTTHKNQVNEDLLAFIAD